MRLTNLQERILRSAASGDGRLIFWILGSGRAVLPGVTEDISGALRALEGAGLLAAVAPDRQQTRGVPERGVGSHILSLTEAGRRCLVDDVPSAPFREDCV